MLSRKSKSDALAWAALAALSSFTWLALASGGRLPAADLPQHALALRRMLDGTTDLLVLRWSFPYLLLYAPAALLAQWTDAVTAMSWTASFTMALLPLSSGCLAAALGRSPAFGAFGLLGAFTMVSGWGFFAVILSASMAGFTTAAAVHYGRRPSVGRAVSLASLLVLTYWAHPIGWLTALAASWVIVPVWRRSFRWRTLWPLIVATAISGALCIVWQAGEETPWLTHVMRTQTVRDDGPFPYRLVGLAHFASAFGRLGALVPAWLTLAGGLAAAATWSALRVRRMLRRGASWPLVRAARASRAPAPAYRRLQRLGPPLAWVAMLLLYLVVPVWIGGVFMVHPRFLLFVGLLAPALVSARHTRAAHGWALAAIVPALWLSGAAAAEVRHNAERSHCIDELVRDVRPGEATLTLSYRLYPEGYLQPLDLHVGAELAARKGGWVDHTFTDRATLPIAYAPGVDREVVPSSLGPDARAYVHAEHGAEFTQWALVDAPEPIDRTVAQVLGAGPYQVAHCGWLTLVRDASVAAGSRPHRRYLPHRVTPTLH